MSQDKINFYYNISHKLVTLGNHSNQSPNEKNTNPDPDSDFRNLRI